jgi:UPF0716 protein FxsA
MAFLVILFIVVPIAELYVIIKVGELIGLWPTLALLFADAILGSLLLRHQGRGAWRRFNEALAARRFPGKEVADGAMIVIGGTLLLAPGFITDIAGLILLIPPTRAIIRRLFRSYFSRRFVVVGGIPGAFGGRGPGPAAPSRDYDFDATAEEVPPDGRGASDNRQLPS